MSAKGHDLFGNEISFAGALRNRFIVPPFSVLDANQGDWKKRKRKWKGLGIRGEEGRDTTTYGSRNSEGENRKDFVGGRMNQHHEHASIFDPVLCEVLYHWFTKEGDSILDPFAGGSVRGIVAGMMGRKYTGIELRPEQVAANKEQSRSIFSSLQEAAFVHWMEGDSLKKLKTLPAQYNFLFSCPPYGNLEKYSELEGDISNMEYPDFLAAYQKIIYRAGKVLKPGGYAAFVVGEFRGRDGGYVGFVPDTIAAFRKAGFLFYNEVILYTSLGTAAFRANTGMKNKKMVKVHQNVLIFKKPGGE